MAQLTRPAGRHAERASFAFTRSSLKLNCTELCIEHIGLRFDSVGNVILLDGAASKRGLKTDRLVQEVLKFDCVPHVHVVPECSLSAYLCPASCTVCTVDHHRSSVAAVPLRGACRPCPLRELDEMRV